MSLALALPQLKTDIEQLLLDLSTSTDPAQARADYAQRLAEAIHTYTLQALVTTAGSSTAQTGHLS